MKEAHLATDALHDESTTEGASPTVSVEELSRTIDLRMLVRRELLASSSLHAPPSARIDAVHRVAQLINEYDPLLLETDVYLAFRLRQLELLELIREKQLEQALYFAEVLNSVKSTNAIINHNLHYNNVSFYFCAPRICATKWRRCRSCCQNWKEHWPFWHLKTPLTPRPILEICMKSLQ